MLIINRQVFFLANLLQCQRVIACLGLRIKFELIVPIYAALSKTPIVCCPELRWVNRFLNSSTFASASSSLACISCLPSNRPLLNASSIEAVVAAGGWATAELLSLLVGSWFGDFTWQREFSDVISRSHAAA